MMLYIIIDQNNTVTRKNIDYDHGNTHFNLQKANISKDARA